MAVDTIQFRVELSGKENVDALKKEVNALNNSKIRLNVEVGNIQNEIDALNKKIRQIQNDKINLKIDSGKADEQIQKLRTQIRDLQNQKADVRMETRDAQSKISMIKQRIAELSNQTVAPKADFSSIETGISKAYNSVQSIASSMGGLFSSLGQTFGGTFVNQFSRMIRRRLVSGIISGMSGVVERYDILNQFPQVMAVLGYTGKEVTKAREELNEAVLGTPTTLSAIIQSAQRFTMLTNDLERGKNLAIATNNALLASGNSLADQANAQEQIVNLLTRGELTGQQWLSLFDGLGVALPYIGEELGYAVDQQQELRAALQEGAFSADEFLDAMIRAATKSGGAIQEMTNLTKGQLSASLENVKTAFTNLGATTIGAIDEALKGETGQGVVGYIIDFSNAIKQNLIPAIKEWISQNPDKITGFIDKLTTYDWMGLLSEIGSNAVKYFGILSDILTALPADVVGKIAVWATPLGNGLNIIAQALGAFKGLSVPIISGVFLALGKFISVLSGQGFGRLVGGAGGVKGIGTNLLATGGLLAEIAAIGAIVFEYAKLAEYIGGLKIGKRFNTNIGVIKDMMVNVSEVVALVTGFITLVAEAGFGGAMLVGEGLTLGIEALIAGMGALVYEFGSLSEFISGLDIDKAKLNKNLESINDIISSTSWLMIGEGLKGFFLGGFELLGEFLTETNVTTFTDIVKKMSTMLEPLEQISSADIDSKSVLDSLDSLTSISTDVVDKLGEVFRADSFDYVGSIQEKAGKLKGVIDAIGAKDGIASSIVAMNKVLSENDIKPSLVSNITNKVGALIDVAKAVFEKTQGLFELDILDPDTGQKIEKGEFTTAQIDNYRKLTESLSGTIGYFLQMATDISNMLTILDEGAIGKAPKYTSMMIGRLTSVLKDSISSLTELYRIPGLEGELYQDNEMNKFSQLTEGLSKTMTYLFEVSTTIDSMMKQLDKMGINYSSRTGATRIGDVIGKFTGMLKDVFAGVAELTTIEGFESIDEDTSILKDSFGYLLGMIEDLSGMTEQIDGLGVTKEGFALGDNLNTIINSLMASLSSISSSELDVATLEESLSQITGFVSQLPTLLTNLQSIQETVNSMFDEDSFTLGEKLNTMLTSLQSLGSTEGSFGKDGILNISTQLLAFDSALSTMATGGIAEVQGAFDALVQIVDSLKSSFDNAKDSANNLRDSLVHIPGVAMNASGSLSALRGTVSALAGSLSGAASMASALASAISSIPSYKQVTVNVQRTGIANAWASQFSRSGGEVQYRSLGGSIFKRVGTDTVPAMLTPGEFVVRRSAVAGLGTKILEQINARDYDGAFRSMMVRLGMGVRPQTVSNVTNNYRDSHASVHFHGHERSRGVDYRRAGRFVRAL